VGVRSFEFGLTGLFENTADKNGDDGIDVENPEIRLKGNRANKNVDLGIEAVDGVDDAGGNTASGNGNPAQCSPSVVCT
jgi:hypothetical protein